jgi:hypothetical protein
MVQEVQIVAWCDIHNTRDDIKVPGKTHTYVLNGVEVEVDACDACYIDSGLATFETTMSKYGRIIDALVVRKASGESPRKGRVPKNADPSHKIHCLLCDWHGWSGSGLQNHIRSEHNLHDIVTMTGKHCPMCNHECLNLSGLSIHMQTRHGCTIGTERYRHVTRALWLMMRNGTDPHGVIAERMRWVAEFNGASDAGAASNAVDEGMLPLESEPVWLPATKENPLVNVAIRVGTAYQQAARPTSRAIAETIHSTGYRISHVGVSRILKGQDRSKWASVQAVGIALGMTEPEVESLRKAWDHDMAATEPA